MSLLDKAQLEQRMAVMVAAVSQDADLKAEVSRQVDEFFAEHRNLTRNPWAQAIATALIFDRITTDQEKQQPNQEKKVA